MPLDPSIILRAGQSQQRDPMQQYANVLAIKSQTQRNALLRQKAEREQAQRDAFRAAVNPETGDIDESKLGRAYVETGDAKGYMEMRKAQGERQNQALDRDTKQLALNVKRVESVAQIVSAATDEPSYQRALQKLKSMGLNTGALPPQFDPQVVQQLSQESMTALERARKAMDEKKFSEQQRHNRATEGNQAPVEVYDPTSPTGTRLVARGQAMGQPGKPGSRGVSLSYDDEGRPILEMGGRSMPGGGQTVEADKKVIRDAQAGLEAARETVGRLERIRETYDPEFLTYGGQFKAAVGSVADKANVSSPEQRDFIGKRRKFTQNVDREFNAYRKEITGAAAAAAELKDLKKAAIATDLSPAEFEASFNEYAEELKRGIRLKARLLREGVQVGDKQFGKRFDELWIGREDDDIAVRAKELQDAGMDEAQGKQILKREGYIK